MIHQCYGSLREYGIMAYQLVLTGRFKKGLKPTEKRGLDIVLLDSIVEKLIHD